MITVVPTSSVSLFTAVDQNLLEKIAANVDFPGESNNLRALSATSRFFWEGLREVRQGRRQSTAERHLDLLLQGARRCESRCDDQRILSCLRGRERNLGDYGIETADAVARYFSCLAHFPLAPRSRLQYRLISSTMTAVGHFIRGSAVAFAAQPIVAALLLPAAIALKSTTTGLHGAVAETVTTYALLNAVGLASVAAVVAAIQPLASALRGQEISYGLALASVDLSDIRRCLRAFTGAMHGVTAASATFGPKRLEAEHVLKKISETYGLDEASAALRQLRA